MAELTIGNVDGRKESESQSWPWREAPVEGEQSRVGERPWRGQSALRRSRKEEDRKQNKTALDSTGDRSRMSDKRTDQRKMGSEITYSE